MRWNEFEPRSSAAIRTWSRWNRRDSRLRQARYDPDAPARGARSLQQCLPGGRFSWHALRSRAWRASALQLGLRGLERAQGDGEGGAAPRVAPHADVAAVPAGELADQPEPDPEPTRAFEGGPKVAAEDPLAIGHRDADAVV